LAITSDSWKQRIWPRLRRILQIEQSVVFVGVLISALFAVITPGAPILFMAVIILTIGNLMYFLQASAARLHASRPFPLNWLIYLPILAVGSLLSALGAIALLRLMQPGVGPYWILFRDTWKIVMVVSMAVGIAGYAVQEVQRKLQEKNKLLEQVVERGSVALQQQEQELNRAREIQTDLLPKTLPQVPGIELAGAWQPARAVGGDYFDVIRLDDSRLGICIGDVSGKGITAALLMANLQAAFRAFATPEAKPSAVCSKLNEFVCGNVAPGKFITFFYAILDVGKRTLTYENAGHCAGLLVKTGGQTEHMRGQGGVLGVDPDWTYADCTLALSAGDRLLFFTDGVTEAENQQEEEFGYEGVIRAATTGPSSAAELKTRVMKEVAEYCRGEFRDDVTLVVACIQ
jgi:sigma-B regulation protein RsbU (phosphoserine phosphatase)